MSLASGVVYLFLLFLNSKGHLRLSRYTALICANILIFTGYQLSKGSIGMDKFFVTVALSPLALFPVSQKKDIFFTITGTLIIATLTPIIPFYLDFFPPIGPDAAKTVSYMLTFCSIVMSLIPPALLFYLTDKYFSEMVQSKQNEVQNSRMAALGQMAAGMAHEINNPLAIIAGRAEQIEDLANKGKLEKEVLQRASGSIHKNTYRITKIVKGLRTFARGGEEDPFVKADAREIIGDTLELCHEKLSTSQITLNNHVQQDAAIWCSQSQVMQVLVNILNNAIDALIESGVKDKTITIGLEESDTQISLFIEDNGPGIPRELMERITEPFFTTKELGKGTGLGLSISKGIMERHHGSMQITSRPGATRFTLHFPRSLAPSASA